MSQQPGDLETMDDASAAQPLRGAVPATAERSALPVPQRATLERTGRRIRIIEYTLVALLVPIDLFLVWQPVAQGSPPVLAMAAFLLLVSSLIYLTALLRYFRRPGRRLHRLRLPEKVGRYSSGEIRRLVLAMFQPHRQRELPEIYITDARDESAFVINSLFFNFIKPLNAVYISKYLFEILKPGEIRAVLAHELAHFYGYMRPLGRVTLALTVFNALLPVQLWSEDILPSPVAVLLAWLAFTCGFALALGFWLGRYGHVDEYLSDLEAARRCGILNVVNSLLGCAKTGEIHFRVQARLIDAVRQDDSLSLKALPALLEQIDRELPATAVTTAELERVIQKILESKPTALQRKPLTKRQQREEAQQIEQIVSTFMLNREFSLLDWTEFDHLPADGRISAAEYPRLIELLQEKPGHQLFAMPTDDPDFAAKTSHPTFRQRLLFLEQCRQEDRSLSLH